MISVEAALGHVFDLVEPVGTERVRLADAAGRVLAEPVVATRDQPPFASSAMDGYAVRDADVRPGARLKVIGEAAAGHAADLQVGAGEAVRIFTGAPVPPGADRVVIQEDVARSDGEITLGDRLDQSRHIRPAGGDFKAGAQIDAPRVLSATDLALLASMNAAELVCSRIPEIALLATGDELVMPGETPRDDQIIASNAFGLKAMIEAAGGHARILPIARDTEASLNTAFDLAAGADMVITIGGASVGDHDLVHKVATARGMAPAFYKVAMRPGKPLMAGRLDDMPMIGLPGNPVSSLVCGTVFILPALRAMLGLGKSPAPRQGATLTEAMPAGGPREHYMRARLSGGQITPADRQDSSLLTVLAGSNALLIRPPNAPPAQAGDVVDCIAL